MDLETFFKPGNVRLLFDTNEQNKPFIAQVGDSFSDHLAREEFSRQWAYNFPAGRYVIVIYRRISVYEEGIQVWCNDDLSDSGKDSRYGSACFVIALDQKLEYEIKTWKRPLYSHIIQNEKDPLQAKIYRDLPSARKKAQQYSRQGYKAAVLEWFEDYDMY